MSQTARDSLEVTVGGRVETVELAQYISEGNDVFYARPGTEDETVFRNVVDLNEYGLPHEFSTDDLVIDVGAHIGSFSYAVLKRGAGKVYAYEAHPINWAIARKNLSAFGDRVSCTNLAVWRSDESARTLYNDVITGYPHTGGISVLWNEQGVPVRSSGLDEILFEVTDGLRKRVRLLKLDCEGSEYPILFTSQHLDVVEEICGEYHEVAPEFVPEQAKVIGRCEYFNSSVLKGLLERQGWDVELEPKVDGYGLFHARRKIGASPDLKISELMSRIRESVARKEAQGKISQLKVQALLRELQEAESVTAADASPDAASSSPPLQVAHPQINLEMELLPIDGDDYHVNDLLKYHDKEFVRNAYRAVLKREADESGYNQHLESLRSGQYNKVDILAALRYSPEGLERNVRIRGLRLPSTLRRLYRFPALGYLLQLAVALVRLPVMVRNYSQFEAHSFVQREKLFDLIQTVAGSVERVEAAMRASLKTAEDSLRSRIEATGDSFKAVTQVQHQQINALFREQQAVLGEQKELFELISASHALKRETGEAASHDAIEEQVKQLSQRIEDLRAEIARQQHTAALMTDEALRMGQELPELKELQALADKERHHLDALYASFEDRFRGEPPEVKERLRFYIPFLKEAGITGGVLDVGCGRGDWLELLAEEGIEARGVDSNRVLVERCLESGFEVAHADALLHLRSLPDESLDAVTAFHVVEHLPFETMVDLLDEARRVLKRGGLLMIETPSPENLVVAACNFYSDPTHRRPVSAHTLKFILQERGFDDIRLQFLHPVEGSPFESADKSLEPLHMWFYGPRDYAIVGSKK